MLRRNMTTNQFFEIERIFELLDRAKKGFIDLPDVVEFMTSLSGGRVLQAGEINLRAERAFARLDIDCDGQIGIWDWKTSLLATEASKYARNELPPRTSYTRHELSPGRVVTSNIGGSAY